MALSVSHKLPAPYDGYKFLQNEAKPDKEAPLDFIFRKFQSECNFFGSLQPNQKIEETFYLRAITRMIASQFSAVLGAVSPVNPLPQTVFCVSGVFGIKNTQAVSRFMTGARQTGQVALRLSAHLDELNSCAQRVVAECPDLYKRVVTAVDGCFAGLTILQETYQTELKALTAPIMERSLVSITIGDQDLESMIGTLKTQGESFRKLLSSWRGQGSSAAEISLPQELAFVAVKLPENIVHVFRPTQEQEQHQQELIKEIASILGFPQAASYISARDQLEPSTREAILQQLQEHYKKLALQFHPDKGTEASRHFQAISAAHTTLQRLLTSQNPQPRL